MMPDFQELATVPKKTFIMSLTFNMLSQLIKRQNSATMKYDARYQF